MRVLLSHCDFIEYKPVKKELKDAEEVEQKLYRFEEILVAFTSIEKGDNTESVDKMVKEIVLVSQRIGIKRILVYPFAHLSNDLASPNNAKKLIIALVEKLSMNNFEVYLAPFGWSKELHIKVKGHPLAESLRVV